MQDIKLTNVSYIVLGLLDWATRATPYDLKQMAASLTDLWSVQHTQLYGEPARLAKAGYLTEEQEATGRRRKTYELTDKGRQALEEWKAAPTEGFTELRDPGLLKLYFGADVRAVATDQLELHRRKLADYEAMASQAPKDAPAGPWLALQAGIGHEREWVNFWENASQHEPRG